MDHMTNEERQEIQAENSLALDCFKDISGEPQYWTPSVFDKNAQILSDWINANLSGGLEHSGSLIGSYELAWRACFSKLTADPDYISWADRQAYKLKLQTTPASEQHRLYDRDPAFRRLYDLLGDSVLREEK